MKNRTRVGLGTAIGIIPASAVASAGVLSTFLTVPAFADDIGYIVNDLESSNISVSSSSVVPVGLNSTYDGTNIAVVFVDSSTNLSQDAQMILQQTDFQTVIVSNGNSFGAASDTSGAGANIATFLNQNGADALVSEFDQINTMSSTYTTTETGVNVPSGSFGISVASGVGIGLGVLALIAVGFVVFRKVFNKKDNKGTAKIVSEDYFSNVSEKLGKEVSAMRELIEKHQEKGLTMSAEKLVSLDKRLGDLFTRLEKKGTNEQVSMAAVKYQDLLKKVIYIMDEGHYIDVALNPELWNKPELRKQNSLDCVDAVDKQILENIKQLNDSQDLEFNITMQALLSNSDDMDEIEELLFKNDDSNKHRTFGK